MSKEYKFPVEGWILTRVKRDWCPEWLFRIYALLPSWLEPFRCIFTRKANFCSDCDALLTTQEVEFYEYRCEKCEQQWLSRIEAWRTGAEDSEFDNKYG